MNDRGRQVKRMAVWGVAMLAGIFLVLMIGVYVLQDRMLYHPTIRSPQSARAAAQQAGLAVITGADGDILGYRSDLSEPVTATIIIFHGNAGEALDRRHYPQALEPRGYRVVLAEYPGYGPRPGSHGQSTLTEAGVELVTQMAEIFPEPVILWGESLGCGVASGVAQRCAGRISGVVLLTPWNNLPDLAAEVMGNSLPFLPIRWLCRDAYDNAEHLKGSPHHLLVVIAEQDEVVPAQHARDLIGEHEGPETVIALPGSGHNDWPRHPAADWWNHADRVIREHMLPTSEAP